MSNEHPFQHLFETLGRTPIAHAESVNRQAYEILSDILTVPLEKSGRCILLRATRAGHGKTHLLSRIQHQMGGTHEFIPLHASFGCRIDAASVIDDTLRCLVRQLPASGGLCVLDLVTRRLFASALQPLVGSGEVPCQDREGALTALRMRPVETFDFHHPNAVTAHWARENFEVLGQRLSQELAQRAGLPVREVAFWVETLFRFAAAPLDHSGRVSILAEAVHKISGGEMERLEALLGLVTQLMRVVLVADDLEGFSSDETAALRFAAFLGTLRQSVDRLDVILSLNLDIWESAFVPRLSGGLADRLSEVVVELEPLKESEMAALLDSRVPGLGAKVLERIDISTSGTHARGLIRAAGMAWLKATAMDSSPQLGHQTPAVAPAPAPLPPVVTKSAVIDVTPVKDSEPLPSAEPQRVPEPAPVIVETPVPETPAIPEPQPPVVNDIAAIHSSVFTFSSPEAPTSAAKMTWPEPSFSTPPPVEMESSAPVAPPVLGPVEPAENYFETDVWIPEPIESWNPPVSEAVESTPVVESPFQAPPQESFAVPQDVTPPKLDSPFQAAPQGFVPAPPAPEQSFSQPPAFQSSGEFVPQGFSNEIQAPQEIPPSSPPPVEAKNDSPFQVASPDLPPAESNIPTVFTPQPHEMFPPQTASPFQAAPVEPSPFQAAPVEPSPFQAAPVEPSPFQAAPPQFIPSEPAPQTFQPFQGAVDPPAQSPFQAAPADFAPVIPNPPFQPQPEPAPATSQAPADEPSTPTAADTDRVDDLLRQFRERYGRGSL